MHPVSRSAGPFPLLLAALAVAVHGCGGSDETATDPGGGGAGGATSCGDDCPSGCGDGVCSTPQESASSCPSDCPSCAPMADITELLTTGELFFGYAVLGSASVTPACGSLEGAKEVAVSFSPDFSGELVLSTQHPSTKLATVLEVREGDCSGASLGCNDEATAGAAGSRLTLPVAAGSSYVAIVETADDEAGIFALGAHRSGVCEGQGVSADITAALLTGERFAVDTSASTQSLRGSCAGDGNPEARYTFTAPVTGTLVATTVHPATTFDTALYARQSAMDGALYCDSVEAEIACAADGAPGGAGTLVRFDVQAGHGYELFVDGAGAGNAGQATLTLGYAATSPAAASLQGCDFESIQDQFAFFAESGQSVYLKVDTVDAATAADTRLRVRAPDGSEIYEADDEVACTFPPPEYDCPEHSFTATATGLHTVEVYVGSSETCADPSLVNYALTVTVADAPSDLILIRDQ